MKIPINGNLFRIKEVPGPLMRQGRRFAVQVRYAAREILLVKDIPEDLKKYVLSAAISEAHLRSRIPLINPKWYD
jgi:hypothetical protein